VIRLAKRDAELCDEFLSIPMRGQVDSLNVSVAAGIKLYGVFRQKRFGGADKGG
jgi:tRNA G18 (ribose-2'-O)-methylase SpoU